MTSIRSNWRILVLSALLVASAAALFVPGAALGDSGASANATGPTNLQYGIQLDGGTRLRAPVVGLTAEDVNVSAVDESRLEQEVADSLGVEIIDVNARPAAGQAGGTVEVFVRNVTEEQFVNALSEAGLQVSVDDVRSGVTDQTRAELVRVIDSKISEAGLAGGDVRQVSTATGERFVVIEATNRDADELRELLSERGAVRVVAYYPNASGTYVNETVLRADDLANIGIPSYEEQYGHYVQVTLTDSSAPEFANTLVDAGYGGGTTCNFGGYGDTAGRCLLIVSDDEVVNSFGVRPQLGQSFRNGDFANDPIFILSGLQSSEEARTLSVNLRAGALPAPLNFDDGTVYSLEPALAQRFKTNSLLTGLVAVVAVSLVVYVRYRDVRVAAPMVVTALSEVVVLLGFAAAVQYPLDLSVIAGFIAVIGTGVDDLIIIADEVMSEGEVRSTRVFRSRFRKAFWVIGAAAATTIIAMSPLAVLSLGDLRGFAIVTILGVLVGVLVTRPAYGDILRSLLTER